MEIRGRVAVVTGAGSGIGRAMAVALAREGARVIAADLDVHGNSETVRLITEAGGTAVATRVDVTRDVDVVDALQLARDQFGALDILCNNAGIGERADELFGLAGTWRRIVEVNLTAVILGTRLGVQAMRGTGGVIVNTASMGGIFPMPSAPVYAATKAGVVNFTRSLGYLHAEAGIRVNAICPSVVDTPILASFEPEQQQAMINQLGLLPPEKIAEGLLELVRDDSRAGAIMRVTTARGIDYAREMRP